MTKGEKRKQKLLETAYDLFLRKGYDGTSVDDIAENAEIAKGTFYYYFGSKEQILGEVIEMMLAAYAKNAEAVLLSDMPIPEKIIGIVSAFHPRAEETTITDEMDRPENLLMHNRINRKLVEIVVPLLTKVTEQGINEGLFEECDCIPERMKVIMYISSALFDGGEYTENDVTVFIDLVEKLTGAKKGTMSFIGELIN